MWAWITTIIVGALCGWIASRIMNTDEQQGGLANIIIGIVGASVANFLFGDVLSIGGQAAGTGFNFWSIVWGVIGSSILIAILKALKVLK